MFFSGTELYTCRLDVHFFGSNLWSCQESQELSQEIDDVLHLLQSVRSKGEASVVSWATPLMTCIVLLVVSIQAWKKFQVYISAAPAAKEKHACVKQQWSLSLSENIFIISTFLITELLKCSRTRFLDGWRKPSRRKHQKGVAALLEYQTLSQNRFKHSASALSNHNWRKRQTANHRSKSWTNCFLLRTIFFSEGTQTWNEGLVVPLCAQFTPLPKVWEQSEPAQRLRLLPGKLWGP